MWSYIPFSSYCVSVYYRFILVYSNIDSFPAKDTYPTQTHYSIYTLRCHSSVMKHKKLWQISSNERHRSRDQNFDIDFFSRLLGVICRFSINIRIELHLFSFALGNERTLFACKSCDALSLLKDLHATSVLSFPNANKKVYFDP